MKHKVHDESRDKLYHSRFRYAVRCYVPNAAFLRSLDHRVIDLIIQRRNTRPRRGFLAMHINESEAQSIHAMCDLMLTWTDDWHKICYPNHLYIYTNSESIIDSITSSALVEHTWIAQAVVDRPQDVVQMLWPTYQYRAYFRECMLAKEQFALFKNFIAGRQDQIKLSRTFGRRLRDQNCYVYRHYHMDFNDSHLPFLLSMVCPDLIRQTVPIIAK